MTVLEAVTSVFHLADYKKSYKNVYGNSVDLKYPLDKLGKMEVKDIYINLKEKTATITILERSTP